MLRWARASRLRTAGTYAALALADCVLVLALVDAVRGERDGLVLALGIALTAALAVLSLLVTVKFVRGAVSVPQMVGEAPGHFDQALLDRYRPIVRYDRQYDYRLLAAESAVATPGNLLMRADGEVIARQGGTPALSLALLAKYPDGIEPDRADCISMAPSYAGDARRWERDSRTPPCIYGRVVEDRGRTWLQYWFWLYYNPKNLFGFGKHEGDWEMVQIGLDPGGRAEVAGYAQHESGEARKFNAQDMDLVGPDGAQRPVVYVAPYSHASYFKGGLTYAYVLGIDHPFGGGPEDHDLPVRPFGDWVDWDGKWGNSERMVANRIGNGPSSPSRQGLKWSRPGLWHSKLKRRGLRVRLGKAVHSLGKRTFPPPPQLTEVRVQNGAVEVRYELAGHRLARARHLYLTIHDGDHVLAGRAVKSAARVGKQTFAIPDPPAQPSVWASAFNGLRQRSEVVQRLAD